MPAEDFLKAAEDPALIRDLAPKARTLEGYLFPSTYRLSHTTTGAQLSKMMTGEFRKQWAKVSTGRDADVRSYRHPRVAGGKGNRGGGRAAAGRERVPQPPGAGMRLQCDPTTIYAALLDHRYRGTIQGRTWPARIHITPMRTPDCRRVRSRIPARKSLRRRSRSRPNSVPVFCREARGRRSPVFDDHGAAREGRDRVSHASKHAEQRKSPLNWRVGWSSTGRPILARLNSHLLSAELAPVSESPICVSCCANAVCLSIPWSKGSGKARSRSWKRACSVCSTNMSERAAAPHGSAAAGDHGERSRPSGGAESQRTAG